MRWIAAALLAIAILLAWLLIDSRAQNSQLQGQVTELSDKRARENLELQEKCSLQAKKILKDPNYIIPVEHGSRVYQEHQSHYNEKLRKCFVLITGNSAEKSATPYSWYSSSLIDAFEERNFASYIWVASGAEDKGNWMQQPAVCSLQPSSLNEQTCTSYKEYRAFVATFME